MKRTIVLLAMLAMILVPAVSQADGSVTLSWVAPQFNCDGSALDDLGGYLLKYYLEDTPQSVLEIDVGNVLTKTLTISGNVEDKTFCFQAVSYDTAGNRSDDPGGCGASEPKCVPFAITYPRPPSALGAVVP